MVQIALSIRIRVLRDQLASATQYHAMDNPVRRVGLPTLLETHSTIKQQSQWSTCK